MRIYLEVIVLLMLVFMFITWKLWDKLSQKKLSKKYKPENDKSRKGGAKNSEPGRTKPDTIIEAKDNGGHGELEERKLLQATDVSSIGENSDSTRTNVKGINKLFRRRRK